MADVKIKRWAPAFILVALLLVGLVEASIYGITLSSALRWVYNTIKDAPWLLLLVCALRPPFIFPISWLVLLCGTIWGLWMGGLYAVIGMLISAASSYWIARFTVPKSQSDSATSKFGAWLQRLRREGFMSVVLMRLMLLPFDMVNFAASALHVNFRDFMLATLIGNTAATLIYASIGASIRLDVILSGHEPPLSEVLDARQLALTIIMLVISLLIARYVKKRSNAPSEIDVE
jgi:uncharacterized membrane protein YdjX (TVP38/TMEM64 family)